MPEDFTLPMRFSPYFHSPEALKILSRICTPLEAAKSGDVIGVDMRFIAVNGYCELLPITEVFVHSGPDDPFCFKQMIARNLPHHLFKEIAPLLIEIQGNGLFTSVFGDIAQTLQLNAGEYFDAIVTPRMVIATQDEYIHTVFDQKHNSTLTQDAINEAMLAVHIGRPETSHEMIEAQSALQTIVDVANSSTPVPDPVDSNVDLPLKLPDLSTIQSL